MAWYEFVIFFSLAIVGVVIVVYFGNRFYTGRKRATTPPDVELDTGQTARRRRRRDSGTVNNSNNTNRNPTDDPDPNQEIIFTIANSRVGVASLVVNRDKLTDSQRVGNDPPPAYDSIVQRNN